MEAEIPFTKDEAPTTAAATKLIDIDEFVRTSRLN